MNEGMNEPTNERWMKYVSVNISGRYNFHIYKQEIKGSAILWAQGTAIIHILLRPRSISRLAHLYRYIATSYLANYVR